MLDLALTLLGLFVLLWVVIPIVGYAVFRSIWR